jgi:hypothetical protein
MVVSVYPHICYLKLADGFQLNFNECTVGLVTFYLPGKFTSYAMLTDLGGGVLRDVPVLKT